MRKKRLHGHRLVISGFRRQMFSYLDSLGITFEKLPSNDLLAATCLKKLGIFLDFRTRAGADELMKRLPQIDKSMRENGTKRPQRVRKVLSDSSFYESREWREIRYKALKQNDGRCELCGAAKADGAQLHVDHIMPRSKWPKLELVLSNLQVLCRDCNLGKSNKDTTDWRRKSAEPIDDEFAEIRRRLGEDM